MRASLCVYKVLPDNWTQYAKAKTESFSAMGVTGTATSVSLPVLYGNQDRKVSTADLINVKAGTADLGIPAFEVARAFGDPIRGGDSGNPIFVPVGNELVLLGGFWKLGTGGVIASFPWLIDYRGAVESIIGQKLQVVDLGEVCVSETKLKILKALAEGTAKGVTDAVLDRALKVEVKPSLKERVKGWFR